MAIDPYSNPPLLGGSGWTAALALLGAGLQDYGAARQGLQGGGVQALLGMQRLAQADQERKEKKAEEAGQKSAQAALLGGLDPTTGITWDTGRQSQAPDDQKALFMRAFPEAGAKAAAASLFPKPMDPGDRFRTVGDSVVDITTGKPIYQAPPAFSFPGISPAGGGTGGTTTSVQPGPSAGADPAQFPADLDMKIGMMEEKYGLPAGSFRALVQAESGGRPGAVSPKGAVGYTQLMPGTARDLGVNAADPDQNLEGGARYLRQQLDKYGNLDHALVAYNWGPGNADMWIKSGADPARLPAETRAYLGKITGGGASPFQVAQANTGTMTDAAPAAAAPTAGQWVRGIDKNGKHVDVEKNTATGETRPFGGGSMFSGNSVEGQALNQLVESGLLTKEQALTWAAGKTATGPNGQLDFVTPQAMRGGAAPAGGTPGGPAITPVRQGQLAPQDKEAIMEADKSAEAAGSAISALNEALKINRQAFQGSSASTKQWLDRNLLPGEWGGQATTDLENIVGTQALGQLKAIFGAAPTEGERKILLDLQGSIQLSADEREAIFKRAIEAAQTRMQRERGRAQALRSGTYYTEGLPQTAQPAQQGGGRVLRFDAQGNMIP